MVQYNYLVIPGYIQPVCSLQRKILASLIQAQCTECQNDTECQTDGIRWSELTNFSEIRKPAGVVVAVLHTLNTRNNTSKSKI